MGAYSKIEWTTHTFNPWWGCTKVSDGCRHCYAETLSKRYGHSVWGPGRVRRQMSDGHWQTPLQWDCAAAASGERYRVFCASMADVFEDEAPAGALERLWDLIARTPNLDWQLLTKRPEKIEAHLPDDWGAGYPNVWLGTSVEDMRVAHRVDALSHVDATVRFLSLEPLIGPLPSLDLDRIDWVIVGGESGPGARPIEAEWVRDIKRQCRRAAVPFFFKQWGGPNKKKAGRLLDGCEFNELPVPRGAQRVEFAAAR